MAHVGRGYEYNYGFENISREFAKRSKKTLFSDLCEHEK